MSRKDMIQKVRKTPWLTVAVFTVFTVLSLMATMPLLGCDKDESEAFGLDDNVGYCPGCKEKGEYHRAECGMQMHYSCVGNHGLCDLCEQRYCDTNIHRVRACGIHYDCSGEIIRLVEGDHETELSCGHYVCEEGHEKCTLCDNCTCTGTHGAGKCKQEELPTDNIQPTEVTEPVCPNCKNSVNVEMEHQKACGHWSCDEGYDPDDHNKLDCTHWTCAENFDEAGHAKCICGTWLCTEGLDLNMHRKRGCGHMECETGTHEQCDSCGAWMCQYESERYRLECSHYVCDSCDKASHAKKGCGCFACDDDCDHNQAPEESATIYCAGGCGAVVNYAEEHKCPSLGCTDYLCNKNVHNYNNSDCKVHYECQLNSDPSHQICVVCQKPICNNLDSHKLLACGLHYQCGTATVENTHIIASCNKNGHYTCDGNEHSQCQ